MIFGKNLIELSGGPSLVIVVRPYRFQDAGEMSLYEGEIIKIIQKSRYTGKS